MTVLDDPAALRAADPGGMLDIVTHLADQCREGYALGLAASLLPEPDGVTSVAICGMGGSAIAGDVVAALAAPRLRLPVLTVRAPSCPSSAGRTRWWSPRRTPGTRRRRSPCSRRPWLGAAGSSRSPRGAAGPARRGARGGPRAGTWRADAARRVRISLAGCAGCARGDGDRADARRGRRGGDRGAGRSGLEAGPDVPLASNPAKDLANELGDRLPVVWGADGIGAVAAIRWKCQFNENAKVPAFASVLPSSITTRSWDGRGTAVRGSR